MREASVGVAICAMLGCTDTGVQANNWLIHMPDLERSQAKNPVMLRSSEHWDERLNTAAEVVIADVLFNEKPLMAKLMACKPLSVTMITDGNGLNQMPVRYELQSSPANPSFAQCVRSALPVGFTLDQIF